MKKPFREFKMEEEKKTENDQESSNTAAEQTNKGTKD
jgi:hypothetical protein